jgi:uncharacterized damage-inducible protein DinB
MALLEDVPWEQAAAKPLAAAHSIWELVLHITAWADICTRRINGEAVEPITAEDWPDPGPASQQTWRAALETLAGTQLVLADLIETLTDEQLDAITPGKDYNNYFLLHGLVQHNLYHAGQIALLKKL